MTRRQNTQNGRVRVAGAAAYTLAELMVAICVIAVMAAILTPSLQSYVARAHISTTRDSLAALAKAMQRFHDDTGVWPLGNNVWPPNNTSAPITVSAAQFSTSDVSMYANPNIAQLPSCNASSGPLQVQCWGGPYVSVGSTMADRGMLDGWGQPFWYAYVAPQASAPNGLIVIWSAGPDAVSQSSALATITHPSPIWLNDDIVQVVGSAF
jgi:Tfp pilus assembly protein PilE